MKSGLALMIIFMVIFLLAILLPLPLLLVGIPPDNQIPIPKTVKPYQLPKPDPDGWITIYRGNPSEKLEPITPIQPQPDFDWLIPLAPIYTENQFQQI